MPNQGPVAGKQGTHMYVFPDKDGKCRMKEDTLYLQSPIILLYTTTYSTVGTLRGTAMFSIPPFLIYIIDSHKTEWSNVDILNTTSHTCSAIQDTLHFMPQVISFIKHNSE